MEVPVKFRAYDEQDNRIYADVLVCNSGGYIGLELELEDGDLEVRTAKYDNSDKGTILCQLVDYTIDGQEVYQGDIIKAYRRDDAGKKKPVLSEVTKLNGCFMAFNCTWHELFRLWQSDFKVVGNIFKNADLLKKKS